jgi:NIMA (never in mitosis gene a)-related kinase
MKGLVLKILSGNYPPIPNCYSENTKNLIAEMLTKDPNKRTSVRKILDKEFLNARIS